MIKLSIDEFQGIDSRKNFYSALLVLMFFIFVVGNISADISPPSSPLKNVITFKYGTFGSQIDTTSRIIKDPTLILPRSKGSVYFNLYVENGHVGDPITVELSHQDKRITIAPIKSVINAEGASTLSYVFSPPPEGWVEGVYEVTANYINNISKTFTFRIQ